MKTLRFLSLALVLVSQLPAADETVTGNLTVTGMIGSVGTIETDSNTVTFGTQGTSFGAQFLYQESDTDTFIIHANRNTASWLWRHSVAVPAMRLDGTHQLILYQADGTTAGITLTPAGNQLSLGTATLTGSGTALTSGGAFTSTGAFTASAGIVNTTGSLTSSTALNLSAGGTAQNITLTPSTSGNVILIPTGSGNVGIGTSSPGVKLDVAGGGRFTGGGVEVRYMGSGTPAFSARYAAGTAASPTATPAASSLAWFLGGGYTGSTWLNTAGMQVVSELAFSGSNAGSSIRFHTTPNNSVTRGEVMRISPSGNVGIGTASWSTSGARLAVHYSSAADQVMTLRNTSPSGLSSIRLENNSGSYMGDIGYYNLAGSAGIRIGGNAATNVYIPSGNVGIGVTNPGTRLDVLGNTRFVTDNGFYGTRVGSAAGGDSFVWLGSRVNAPVIQGSNGAFGSVLPLALQAEGGNVGIGTVVPAERLVIDAPSGADKFIRFDEGGVFKGLVGVIGVNNHGASPGNVGDIVLRSDQDLLLAPSGAVRMILKNGGNVGIGTTNPTSKLQLEKTANDAVSLANSFFFFADTPLGAGLLGQQKLTTPYAFVLQAQNQTNNAFFPISLNPNGGNVGVGTASPDAKLHVNGMAIFDLHPAIVHRASGDLDTNGAAYLSWQDNSGGSYLERGWIGFGKGNASVGLQNNAGPIELITPGGIGLFIGPSSNVGIGTTTPTHKLAVNGTIRAKEVVVDTGWADYVFEDDYRLVPLAEVESHIKAKKHLPGIPSAAEVAEHGVSMGDMQAKLLSKVEELTLHLIAQEKRLTQLEAENRDLRAQLRHP